jgi:trk system potassium uptake protein TrkH
MKKLYLLVLLIWLAVCISGALPYYLSGYIGNFTDALFESFSGFTTTGASILPDRSGNDLIPFPAWLLFWRSFTQWAGGLGVLFIFAVIPVYTTGGFQLKKILSVNSGEKKIMPRFKKFIFYLHHKLFHRRL